MPLNPFLYKRLEQWLGRVEVVNEGERMLATAARGFDDRPRLAISHAGEYYRVCCPYCGDRKFRLYVNHMFGQRDDYGRRMTFLATCFNETACMLNPEHSSDFWDTISGMDDEVLEKARIVRGVKVAAEDREAVPPGPCTRLDDLPPTHEARAYLEARGFDPDELARTYGVSYCQRSHFFLASRRIVVPLWSGGKLRGWQCRYVGDLNWKDKSKNYPPKYFTMPGMKRRLHLYNSDRAFRYKTGVIVEGPTDAWRLGPMAVCTMGASMSDAQQRMFVRAFRKRSAVLLYDPEVMSEPHVVRLAEALASQIPKFAAVTLPAGTDPGSLDRDLLRQLVLDGARRQGVRVSFRKAER